VRHRIHLLRTETGKKIELIYYEITDKGIVRRRVEIR